jgi:hypothetical protein
MPKLPAREQDATADLMKLAAGLEELARRHRRESAKRQDDHNRESRKWKQRDDAVRIAASLMPSEMRPGAYLDADGRLSAEPRYGGTAIPGRVHYDPRQLGKHVGGANVNEGRFEGRKVFGRAHGGVLPQVSEAPVTGGNDGYITYPGSSTLLPETNEQRAQRLLVDEDRRQFMQGSIKYITEQEAMMKRMRKPNAAAPAVDLGFHGSALVGLD